jgi:small subunit ribosomal protein S8
MLHDPIADMISAVKNAIAAGKTSCAVPHSELKEGILRVLKDKGVVLSYAKKGKRLKKILSIELRPISSRTGLTALKRVSKPSRRVYSSAQSLRLPHRPGAVMVVSTPKGVLSHDEAKQQAVGGEVLLIAW